MQYIVCSDSMPGSWGASETVEEARNNWRANGGRGAYVVFEIDPFWTNARMDQFATIHADATDPTVPYEERPRVAKSAYRISTNGRKSVIEL